MHLSTTVDDDVLRRTQIRTIKEYTSVNTVLSEHLISYMKWSELLREAIRNLLRLSASGSALYRWKPCARRAPLGPRSWLPITRIFEHPSAARTCSQVAPVRTEPMAKSPTHTSVSPGPTSH